MVADMPVEDIDQWLRKPDCFVWVALRDATDDELRQVQQSFDLHEGAVFVGRNFVLYALMDAVVDRYFPILEARSNIQRLYDLKRRATVLRHVVAPLLEVVGKLHGGRVPEVCARSQEYFRDVHDHLARINGAHQRRHRRHPRHPRHGHLRGVHRAGRHLGHELRAHARAEVAVWLSVGAGRDRQCGRFPVLALQALGLAVSQPSQFSARRQAI